MSPVDPTPAASLIPVPSRRLAMDWSLVLISQGIEAGIEQFPETDAWALSVNPTDHARSLEVLRLYRRENRGWPWRRELALPDFVFDAGSLIWVVLITFFFWLSEAEPRFREAGSMNLASFAAGQWWRAVTAVFLHADIGHLASNAAIGFLLLGLTLGRYGTGIGTLAALLAGVAGNIAVWLLATPPRNGLGASGMVLGSLGLLAAQWFSVRGARPRLLLMGLGGAVFLFMLLGLTPGTDVLAHSGGFVGGLFIGLALGRFPNLNRSASANIVAGIAFALLTIGCWWLALR